MKNLEFEYWDILNKLIDDRIDMFGVHDTIEYLIENGLSPKQLCDDLLFDDDDIHEVVVKRFVTEVEGE